MADANAVKTECPVPSKPDVSINLVKDEDTPMSIPLNLIQPLVNTACEVNGAVNGLKESIVNCHETIAETPKNGPIVPKNEEPKMSIDSKPAENPIETPAEVPNIPVKGPEIVAESQTGAPIIPCNEESKITAVDAGKPIENTPQTSTKAPEIVAETQNTPIIPNNEGQKAPADPNIACKLPEAPADPNIACKLPETPAVIEIAKSAEPIPTSSTNGPEIAANSIPISNCAAGNSETVTENVKNDESSKSATCENASKPVIPVVSERDLRRKQNDEWAKRESFLLEQIAILQKEQGDTSIKGYQLQLKVKTEENYILKAKIINLETELSAVLKKPNAKNKDIVEKIKKQHEDLLTKARGMLFDKTKMIKNQELQIEALGNQVSSLKEVVSITKDLLNIRNMEVEQLQQRMECMDLKMSAEKERHSMLLDKVNTGSKVNDLLKKEYETQLAIFKELKSKYEEKFQTLEKNQIQPSTSQEQN